MDTRITGFVRAGSLEELKAKGRLVVHGPHRPILVVHYKNRVFAAPAAAAVAFSATWRPAACFQNEPRAVRKRPVRRVLRSKCRSID
jgi:hypothetical protein